MKNPKEKDMADSTRDAQEQQRRRKKTPLRGGTQGGEAARLVDPNNSAGGTPAIASPAGGIHPEKPSRAIPNTEAGEPEPQPPPNPKKDLSRDS